MNVVLYAVAFCFFASHCLFGGEAGVTYTFQALTGLVGDTPRFERTYCHDQYSMSGEPTAFSLICAPNIPPTNSKKQLGDHNLLSASNVSIRATSTTEGVTLVVDSRNIAIPKELFEGTEEDILRIALECIRLTASLTHIQNYTLRIEVPEGIREKADRIQTDFLAHDKSKPFVHHPAES